MTWTIGDLIGTDVAYESSDGLAHGTVIKATYCTSGGPVLLIDPACRPCEVHAPILLHGPPAAALIASLNHQPHAA